jgi:flagellar protein FliS
MFPYDGMIRRIEEARQACLDGRIEERWQATQKAARICDALHASLDRDRGGAVADALDQWYVMIGLKIQQVNVSNDPLQCGELIGLLRDVRTSWDRITAGPTPAARSAPPVAPGETLRA